MSALIIQFPPARQPHIQRIAAEMVAASDSGSRTRAIEASELLDGLSPAENSAVWRVYLALKGDEGGAA